MDNRIVYFDGVCNLCNGFVQFLIEQDKKQIFRFASLQSSSGRVMLNASGKNAEEFDSVVYQKDGRLLTKSDAVLAIAKDLGGFWKLMQVGIIIPPFMRDGIYDLVAKNRFILFGKRDECMVPTPELKARFLD